MIGCCDELRMGVIYRGPGLPALVFEDQDVPEPRVSPQVDQSGAPGLEHQDDVIHFHIGHFEISRRGFDDDLVGADSGHRVIEPYRLSHHLAFDAEGWKAVGEDPHLPVVAVATSRNRKNRRRRHGFVARGEGVVGWLPDCGVVAP